ncbi:hypothetical protein [Chroococcidiopsis sp. CCMEE 29]|uniref:hypothetical protein n=1 Tax=Chroococcidiopsis sp. CCMEE 29 TaxID=155894 RepID=UPI002022325E|nr:hypothetical protein [Chroococcidiopsis sp. CCMEE 29]
MLLNQEEQARYDDIASMLDSDNPLHVKIAQYVLDQHVYLSDFAWRYYCEDGRGIVRIAPESIGYKISYTKVLLMGDGLKLMFGYDPKKDFLLGWWEDEDFQDIVRIVPPYPPEAFI